MLWAELYSSAIKNSGLLFLDLQEAFPKQLCPFPRGLSLKAERGFVRRSEVV